MSDDAAGALGEGGDAASRDRALRRLTDVRAAFTPLLLDREPPPSQLGRLDETYRRWARRDRPAEREVRGELGLLLLTRLMLVHATGVERAAWEDVRARLQAILDDDAVRGALARRYGPHGDVDLDTATIHRLGTTSFILRCAQRMGRARRTVALKCLMLPYSTIPEIAAATEAYADRYQSGGRHMPAVYASSRLWVEMDFIEGRTLEEVLDDEARPGTGARRIDRVSRYGVPLLTALAATPYPHLDVSPSNVIVRERADDDGEGSVVEMVLIDFGENYLLTHAAGGGRLDARVTRFVAPERRRGRDHPALSGSEDLYSAGRILLALAGDHGGAGAFLELYEHAPMLGRLLEDLVDEDPRNRLLLTDRAPGTTIDAEERARLFRDLRERLLQAIRAHRTLVEVTPTLTAGERRPGMLGRGLAALGSLPRMVTAIRQPMEFARLGDVFGQGRGDDGRRRLAADFRYLFRWVFTCSWSWAAAWSVSAALIVGDVVHTSLLPDLTDVVRQGFPPIDAGAIAAHYRSAFRPVDWDTVLARLVVLSFGITVARYYLEIFSTLTARHLAASGSRLAEATMRSLVVWFGPAAVVTQLWLTPHWLILGSIFALPIVLNNYATCRLASRLVARGARFSTVRDSDLARRIDVFSEWWKLMLAYAALMALIGVLVEVGWARDVWVYAVAVIVVNMVKLYRSNCGKLAPATRAALARALVTGERLEALESRA